MNLTRVVSRRSPKLDLLRTSFPTPISWRTLGSSTRHSSSTPTLDPTMAKSQDSESQSQNKVPLPLPEPGNSNSTTLDVSGGGSTVKLDHLGPLIVNQDGTLSRISNWEHMSEIERQNTLRVLGKRNKQRMEKLKAAEAEEAAKESGS